MRSVLVWLVVAPFAVWAGLRWSPYDGLWPWVPIVAYTPYAAAASVLALVLAGALRRWVAGAVALVTVAALALAVLPRWFADTGGERVAGGEPVGGGRTLRVLAANLMVGSGDPAGLMELVTRLRPDVLTLQELTPKAAAALDQAGLRKVLPQAVVRPLPGVGGSGVYSRYPLTAGPAIQFGAFGQARAVLTEPGGTKVEVVSVHPCAPQYVGPTLCWRQGLVALPRGGGVTRVLAGDFNATLDHVPMRDLLAAGYRDAADVTGRGFTATYWPKGGRAPGVVIDHVLASAGMGVRAFTVEHLERTDHRPVFAELTLP
ncbi:endonuclease/exonuclease/phosphatase family protein [Nonomuraea guangzhouensis]|uniref:Endonuclease/exonuclease/phosphatase family protein n=1 Tax=Nonomuraea guangzhouensis TaxID=1291555 RepID=A0ABW4G7N3_9ACTN|nr:endonuclease/exonuclease/phosphatase family protein [Nonomuraea guangzhouensis]